MSVIANILVGLCSTWTVAGLAATHHVTRRRAAPTLPSNLSPASDAPLPAISVLKPLCGADAGLERNLETFFTQDHHAFELVFGVEDPADPALEVVRALSERYPAVKVVVVVHGQPSPRAAHDRPQSTEHSSEQSTAASRSGFNPKVRNLRGMLPHASHELVLISDSNVRAPAHYVSELAATYAADPALGIITNLFAGVGENTLGAALENVQLNGFCAAGSALPTLLGDPLVIGKSMLMPRSLLERLGGLERVKDVLAEDYVLGKTFQHAGYRVAIAPSVLSNVTSDMSLKAFHDRHLRWGMLRWRLRPPAYLLEILASPLWLLPLACWAYGLLPALVWCLSVTLLRDVGGWLLLRGRSRLWVPVLLGPLREVIIAATWARALFKRHIQWRNNRVRLGAGTLLFEARGRPTPRPCILLRWAR